MITGQRFYLLFPMKWALLLHRTLHTVMCWLTQTNSKRAWAETCDTKSQKKPFLLGLLPLVFISGTKANRPVRTANGFPMQDYQPKPFARLSRSCLTCWPLTSLGVPMPFTHTLSSSGFCRLLPHPECTEPATWFQFYPLLVVLLGKFIPFFLRRILDWFHECLSAGI